MTRALWLLAAIATYLLSGIDIVGSDEHVAIRRFGRLEPELRSSGLHWDGPWPFVRRNRLNLAELRTVSIGSIPSQSGEILPTSGSRPCPLLTGDKNVLEVRAQLHYRIDPLRVSDYLFHTADLERRLSTLLESRLVELAAQVDVDYLHTLGVADLNTRLTIDLQKLAEPMRLGILVDRVTLESVNPPAQVLADFQDVANARSEAAQVIQQARTYAEQRVTAATATARERIAGAESDRRATVTAAVALSERFVRLHQELQGDPNDASLSYETRKARWEQQLTRTFLQEMMAAGVKTWVFDSEQPVRLQIQGRRPERVPAPPIVD